MDHRRQPKEHPDDGKHPFSACFITKGSLKTNVNINSINPLILQQDIKKIAHPH